MWRSSSRGFSHAAGHSTKGALLCYRCAPVSQGVRGMKLTTVLHEDRRKIVAVMDDGLIDLHTDVSGGGELPRTLRGLLAGGEEALQETRRRIRASTSRIPFAESQLLAPIAD